MPGRTLIELMETSAQRSPENIYLYEKPKDEYVGLTYAETRELIHRFSAGLQALGLRKGDRVALVSEGRALWVVAEMAVLYAGAINVPISVKINEPNELKFRMAHSGCRMAVVSATQAPKVEAIRRDLPDLEMLVLLDGGGRMPDEIGAKRLLALGDEWLAKNRESFETTYDGVEEDDPATISYTSGTTADPKGIVLTHRNYTANVEQGLAMVELGSDWVSLVIIPWDHSFGHTVGIYILMKKGAALAAVQAGKSAMDTLRNISDNLREVRPHFLLSVPALAANFRKNIEKGIRQKGPRAERLFRMALKNAYAYIGDGWNKGQGARALRRPLHAVFDRILFSRIREEGFGGRLEFFIGGGAYLDAEIQRFFYAIGIPMYQGYGLTEAAPIISTNAPEAHKLGTSGRLLPNLELRICDEEGRDLPPGRKGEILVRGENVMAGYWDNPRATKEALREGWLHTGDLGFVDEDGYLYVLGRVKSLLISSNGEKYSPEGIEEALVSLSPFIEQVMLHNDHDPYTVALIVPNREALKDHLHLKGFSCLTEEGQKAALAVFQEAIDSFRRGGEREGLFETEWLPAAFAVLGEGFTEDNRMLNSSLKLVRRRVTEFYRSRLDHLYTPEGKDPLNKRNRTIISRLEE
jgi:long-chain acyl-CoA synthetase